jgi:Zn-dependent protease with chaperone function
MHHPVTLFVERPGTREESQAASVAFEPDAVRVELDGAPPFVLPWRDLGARWGGRDSKQIVLFRKAGSPPLRFYLDTPEGEHAFKELPGPEAERWRVELEESRSAIRRVRWGWRAKAALSVLIGVPALGFAYGFFIAFVAFFLPVSWEKRFAALIPAPPVVSVPAQDMVKTLGHRLLATVPKQPYDFRFYVSPDPSVNAAALPGGVVIINRGLIAQAGSPEEVAGAIAHEIQHVLHRHALRELLHTMGLFVAADALFTGGGQTAAYGATLLAETKYDRSQEEQADLEGLQMMEKAGLSGEGMARLFDRMGTLEKKEGGKHGFWSTHPAPAQRSAAIRKRLDQNAAVQALALDWKAVQASLRADD